MVLLCRSDVWLRGGAISLGVCHNSSASKLAHICISVTQILPGNDHLRQVRRPSVIPPPRSCGSLLKWGQCLSDMDGVDQGVVPSRMGEGVFVGMGYKVVGEIQIPGDGEVEGFEQRVLVYGFLG